jgi:hypothetical protein
MTLDDLEASWSSVSPQTTGDGISGRRATGLPHDRPVYLAVDGHGHRHLLIQVPDGTAPVCQRETKGLEVITARFQVGPNPEALYVDLICTDVNQHQIFSAVAQDMIRLLRTSPGQLRGLVLNALARWRTFWSVRTAGLSSEEALGLFGELWFMRRWLGPINIQTIQRWRVSESARHDFQSPKASVEVKATAHHATGNPIHQIAGLDQLADPEQGKLYLFSLQVCDDALAMNTLHSIVEGIADDLRNDPAALTLLNEKLAANGYTPADRQAAPRSFRIVAERLYLVTHDFPRLVRSSFLPAGLATGIVDVRYGVDLGACQKWLICTSPAAANLSTCFASL